MISNNAFVKTKDAAVRFCCRQTLQLLFLYGSRRGKTTVISTTTITVAANWTAAVACTPYSYCTSRCVIIARSN